MKINYKRKKIWKSLIIIFGIIIFSLSLFYTNDLVNKIEIEENKKMELWVKSQKELIENEIAFDINPLAMNIIQNNSTIPIIWTQDSIISINKDFIVVKKDSILEKSNLFQQEFIDTINKNELNKFIISSRNLHHSKKDLEDVSEHVNSFFMKHLNIMFQQEKIIEISFLEEKQYMYYKDSLLLNKLRYYPALQLLVISIFIFISYIAFSYSRKAEQNKVWVGMSKETAHQIGTPLSSLMGHVEILKSEKNKFADQISEDVKKLEIIANRFSKIGASPELKEENISSIIEKVTEYYKSRFENKIKFKISDSNKKICCKLNKTLFAWVIENIIKNGIDAMKGQGSIIIDIQKEKKQIVINIIDSGPGLDKGINGKIFEPGYTTKKRGWGLGLSLAKRIIEDYHKGKLQIKPNKITTGLHMCVILKSF